MALIRVKMPDGTIKEIASLPGAKGEPGEQGLRGIDGSTPVKGKDYFTSEEKAELVEEIAEFVTGDIETALDRIIAIQESLIGGGISLISFTISGTSYQAKEGMTWGEWVESEYNTGGWSVCPWAGNNIYDGSENFIYYSGFVLVSDEIVANHDYGTMMF